MAIQLQWVEGDASKAENSFFKINQQAAPIDPTELKLLESRKKPNSIAARAIIRSGTGHKYWSSFSDDIQEQIEKIAKEINEILFEPKLETPIKTLDIPVGGNVVQSLPLILDFVNIVNNIDFKNQIINNDTTGLETIKMLKSVRKIAYRLNGNHPSSLGLHPIVYCYSKQGRYRRASLLAIVDFIIELDKRKKINDFIKVRGKFENFLLEHDYFIQQIFNHKRGIHKSYPSISLFFQEIVTNLKAEKSSKDTIYEITSTDNFKYLNVPKESQKTNASGKDFKTNKKSQIFITEALQKTPRCKICNGLIHRNSISIDHIKRKQDGGLATLDNGQVTHPYCNTGYKN